MGNNYTTEYKMLKGKSGTVHDGNIARKVGSEDWKRLFCAGEGESFNGFSGTTEFESFPIRQLFLNKHKQFPSEWDTGYFSKKDIHEYASNNEKRVIATHYHTDKSVEKCLIYLGGKEHIYVYLYDRSSNYSPLKDHYAVCLLFTKKTKRVERIMDNFIKLIIPEKEENNGYLNILISSQGGYMLQRQEIKCPDIDFSINYNEDFEPIHKLIIDRLSEDKSKGLVLLHGNAGTGKTTYIRYLINKLKKRIIYIPPSMANSIADPDLIKFFMAYSNSILVIEDAENVLMKRAAHSTQAISNILNLSDGLLSDCANIQIVATFNTDVLNIDKALLRKGRLIAKYEFTPLEKNRAKKLSDKLGINIEGENTLADIYNATDESFNKKTSKIGF